MELDDKTKFTIGIVKWVAFAGGILIMAGMWGCPQYGVYSSRLGGEAELARAEYSRRTAVVEAQAKFDSAKLLNQAEVARADGLAMATDRVAKSFGGSENYLRYLWIQGLENTDSKVIYVPTEAGLPLLEAGKRQ